MEIDEGVWWNISVPKNRFSEKIVLNEQTGKNPIFITCPMINPVATTAVDCPVPDILLQPYWKIDLHVTVAQAVLGIPGRDFHDRECRNIRQCISLDDEPVFYTEFCIPVTDVRSFPIRI